MTLVISVALLKGGVGKTTTAVALAEAATVAGPVYLIDADPMGSAMRWAELAQACGRPLRATVKGDASPTLGRRLADLPAAVVVIDTPPPGPGTLSITRAAIQAARIVLMPIPARTADLDRIPATLNLAKHQDRWILAVPTLTRHTSAEPAARAALEGVEGVEVLNTALPLRVAVALNYGKRPVGILAQFGTNLLTEITERATAQ